MPELRPITQKEAFAFIERHHRHHNVPVGALWHHAAHDEDGRLCGVAVVGRPVARKIDDGLTCEVTRLCTDGTYNACSLLYAAARRVAIDKGFRRGVTYILHSEDGSSLRAAGWRFLGYSRYRLGGERAAARFRAWQRRRVPPPRGLPLFASPCRALARGLLRVPRQIGERP